MIRRSAAAFATLVLLACSDAAGPRPGTGEELLLVVNSTAASLSVVPIERPGDAVEIPLGGTTPTPVGVAARDGIGLVPMGLDNSVVVVDLAQRSVLRTIPLAAGSGATGAAIVNDSIAWVANPGLNTVTRVNYRTGDTLSVPVGRYPQGVALAGGRLFVVNGNLESFEPAGPSWLTVLDAETGEPAATDSIPLSGPGNAAFSAAADGLLYVMSTGDYFEGAGVLSVVDPDALVEVAALDDFGTGPGNPAVDPERNRGYVSSYAEGVMAFETGTHTVLRGAGEGVAVPANAAVTVDGAGRVYAISTGPCSGGEAGTAHVLDSALEEIATIPLGECPVGATVVAVP